MTDKPIQGDDVELKPCPFCGGAVKLERTRATDMNGRKGWGIVCRSGRGLGGTCCLEIIPSAQKAAAIERWNTRQPDQSLEKLEMVKEALMPFAEAAENDDNETPSHAEIWDSPEAMMITYADLRRAREALAMLEEG